MERGVVMIGNIPHGFYEKEMFGYFSQFGKVLRLRISKNRKTGKRRNYGFIEFESQEVAKIVANTMNNYLMFDHIIKCEFIEKSKLLEKPKLFKNWNKEFVSSRDIHKSSHNKNKSIEREILLFRKRLRNVRQMEEKLKQKGLDFKCQIINLPNISKLRQEMSQQTNETNVELKTSKDTQKKPKMAPKQTPKQTPKKESLKTPERKPMETVFLSKSSDRRRSLKNVVYPRLLKFSILLSANKKKFV